MNHPEVSYSEPHHLMDSIVKRNKRPFVANCYTMDLKEYSGLPVNRPLGSQVCVERIRDGEAG